jgi:hypothetical protein
MEGSKNNSLMNAQAKKGGSAKLPPMPNATNP